MKLPVPAHIRKSLSSFVDEGQSINSPDPYRYFALRNAAVVVDRRDGRVLKWRGEAWQADPRKATGVYEQGTMMSAAEFELRYEAATRSLRTLA